LIDVLGSAGGVAGERRRRDRGVSDSDEDRGGANQCTAPEAPLGARGDAEEVKWFGAQAEGGAHRGDANGGRRKPRERW
jgi:hypothetical protein